MLRLDSADRHYQHARSDHHYQRHHSRWLNHRATNDQRRMASGNRIDEQAERLVPPLSIKFVQKGLVLDIDRI